MGVQFVVIILVVACCVAYAAYRIYLSLKHIDDPCANCIGCSLKDLKQAANTKQARNARHGGNCKDFKPTEKSRCDKARNGLKGDKEQLAQTEEESKP